MTQRHNSNMPPPPPWNNSSWINNNLTSWEAQIGTTSESPVDEMTNMSLKSGTGWEDNVTNNNSAADWDNLTPTSSSQHTVGSTWRNWNCEDPRAERTAEGPIRCSSSRYSGRIVEVVVQGVTYPVHEDIFLTQLCLSTSYTPRVEFHAITNSNFEALLDLAYLGATSRLNHLSVEDFLEIEAFAVIHESVTVLSASLMLRKAPVLDAALAEKVELVFRQGPDWTFIEYFRQSVKSEFENHLESSNFRAHLLECLMRTFKKSPKAMELVTWTLHSMWADLASPKAAKNQANGWSPTPGNSWVPAQSWNTNQQPHTAWEQQTTRMPQNTEQDAHNFRAWPQCTWGCCNSQSAIPNSNGCVAAKSDLPSYPPVPSDYADDETPPEEEVSPLAPCAVSTTPQVWSSTPVRHSAPTFDVHPSIAKYQITALEQTSALARCIYRYMQNSENDRTASVIAEDLGCTENETYNALSELVNADLVGHDWLDRGNPAYFCIRNPQFPTSPFDDASEDLPVDEVRHNNNASAAAWGDNSNNNTRDSGGNNALDTDWERNPNANNFNVSSWNKSKNAGGDDDTDWESDSNVTKTTDVEINTKPLEETSALARCVYLYLRGLAFDVPAATVAGDLGCRKDEAICALAELCATKRIISYYSAWDGEWIYKRIPDNDDNAGGNLTADNAVYDSANDDKDNKWVPGTYNINISADEEAGILAGTSALARCVLHWLHKTYNLRCVLTCEAENVATNVGCSTAEAQSALLVLNDFGLIVWRDPGIDWTYGPKGGW